MLFNESTCGLRKERDDHGRAQDIYPNKRPHLSRIEKNIYYIQADKFLNGMLHNHPSGDPTPSEADIAMTSRIAQIADSLGITIHDHLIIGASKELSFRTEGLL